MNDEITVKAPTRKLLKKGQVYGHREGCGCFRCTGVAWNKGIKRWWKSYQWVKGQHASPKTEVKKGQRLSPKTEYKRGQMPWSSLNRDKMPQEEAHFQWKGENAGYVSKHKWVSKHKGKPSLCEHCGTTEAKRFEWANVSGEYKRELDDYIRLCKSCHNKYDLQSKQFRGGGVRWMKSS